MPGNHGIYAVYRNTAQRDDWIPGGGGGPENPNVRNVEDGSPITESQVAEQEEK
jgi:hypothetical protein